MVNIEVGLGDKETSRFMIMLISPDDNRFDGINAGAQQTLPTCFLSVKNIKYHESVCLLRIKEESSQDSICSSI